MNDEEAGASPELVGRRFGMLTVTERAASRRGRSFWRCRCDCGGGALKSTRSLRFPKGKIPPHCGCIQPCKTHGLAHTPEYDTWSAMMQRCYDSDNAGWHRYGGRGISVCARWLDVRNFVADMGKRPDGHSLDRINNDGNYEPGNCRWATPREQSENICTNHWVMCRGARVTVTEAARRCGISESSVRGHERRGTPNKYGIAPVGAPESWTPAWVKLTSDPASWPERKQVVAIVQLNATRRVIVRTVFVWTCDWTVHFGHPDGTSAYWLPLPSPPVTP